MSTAWSTDHWQPIFPTVTCFGGQHTGRQRFCGNVLNSLTVFVQHFNELEIDGELHTGSVLGQEKQDHFAHCFEQDVKPFIYYCSELLHGLVLCYPLDQTAVGAPKRKRIPGCWEAPKHLSSKCGLYSTLSNLTNFRLSILWHQKQLQWPTGSLRSPYPMLTNKVLAIISFRPELTSDDSEKIESNSPTVNNLARFLLSA